MGRLLKKLIEEGYAGQICLGHDVTNKMMGKQAGGYGYTRFPTFVQQRLMEEGFSEDVYQQLTIKNPARILAY